ncbi:MAG: hypothetical protein AB7L66_08820 [Gemmatimonadales bacterium]
MLTILGTIAVVGVLIWVFGGGRQRAVPAPEDDVTTPVDYDELEAAERELAEDADPRTLEDDDDWGPGVA